MLDFSQEGVEGFRTRFFVAAVVLGLFFLLVIIRLFSLQIIRGKEFWLFSSEHTVKEIRYPAPRGVIFDRNRLPLVQSRPSFELVMIRQHVKDFERVKKTLHELLGVSPALMDSKWQELKQQAAFYPITLVSDLALEQVAKIRAGQALQIENNDDLDLRGIDVIPTPLRDYPLVVDNFLGYLKEISPKELEDYQTTHPGRYDMGDLVGAAGLEHRWEEYLKGEDGTHQRVVDAVGREILTSEMAAYVQDREPRPGANLILSIDSRLQSVAEQGFGDKKGALVAIDVKTGGILAMVSRPTYNPRDLEGMNGAQWQQLINNPDKLFLNRTIQGAYPPGSTYKIITAIAGLEEHVMTPEEKINCPGGLNFGGRFFHCWNARGHGAVSLVTAIAQSCDTYFYTIGIRLGVDRLAKYANILGLGKPTGVDLDGERGGMIPTSEWKQRVFKTPWQPGENLSIAIGQGYDTVTPIGNALVIAQVASGKILKPHLVERVEDINGHPLLQYESVPEALPISAETLKWVREGLRQVVAAPGGTAHRHFTTEFSMAAKTGTAQVVSNEGKSHGIHDEGDHALFVVYSTVEDPQIAISVVVEHGGHGGVVAAPIAKAVIAKYMELQKTKNAE